MNRFGAGPYRRMLSVALKRPALVLAVAVGVFVGSLGLFPLVGVSLFPKAEKPQFLINIDTPEGTSLARTDAVTHDVETLLATRPASVSISSVGISPVSRSSTSVNRRGVH